MKSFQITLSTTPDVVIAKAKQTIEKNGVAFSGDVHSGSFSGNGIKGQYIVEGQILTITITEKPVAIPWMVVESIIRGFFAFDDDTEEPTKSQDSAQSNKSNEDVSPMDKKEMAEDIISSHVIWALGGALIPLPLADVAAVTAVQVGMLEQLANLYDVGFTQSSGKRFVSALAGTTIAKLGSSLVKFIPGVGTIIGGVAMSATSATSTYALGYVAMGQFESEGSLASINLNKAKMAYETAFKRGEEVVSNLQKVQESTSSQKPESDDIFESIEQLGQLRDRGFISKEDFELQKQKLLARL